jgi:hypothetical protein
MKWQDSVETVQRAFEICIPRKKVSVNQIKKDYNGGGRLLACREMKKNVYTVLVGIPEGK